MESGTFFVHQVDLGMVQSNSQVRSFCVRAVRGRPWQGFFYAEIRAGHLFLRVLVRQRVGDEGLKVL